ncbi:hypothetical protein LROSL1_1311 [Furfurilactobacillus rossiae]|uniref:hypothetical protein n=1 Tax=Furfurilactobacillus rossiae TaxID=231049 RepID=UPI0015C1102C|nr:hypothetical protein [Furfurilactobacillus rossiae]QLE64128.1 hypothetical protein LROSL1_1311 [Furfurilactobacillus rossiae]
MKIKKNTIVIIVVIAVATVGMGIYNAIPKGLNATYTNIRGVQRAASGLGTQKTTIILDGFNYREEIENKFKSPVTKQITSRQYHAYHGTFTTSKDASGTTVKFKGRMSDESKTAVISNDGEKMLTQYGLKLSQQK